MEREITKEYTNGEITVVWKPHICMHSTICWKHLFSVFNPGGKPWITMSGASSERIAQQVKECPSGALTYYENKNEQSNDKSPD